MTVKRLQMTKQQAAKCAERSMRWARENRERYNTIQRRCRVKLRQEAIEQYGGKCACCKDSRIEFLAIDHINGGGTRHRLRLGKGRKVGGRAFYLFLRKNKYPSGYRVLCHNCNMAKGAYGYCPHFILIEDKIWRRNRLF